MYAYPVGSFRATAMNVVDGDTFDLEVDVGFHLIKKDRFRLFGVDAFELNSKEAGKRDLARKGRDFVSHAFGFDREDFVPAWGLRIVTHKDPDNFGRWLAEVYYFDENGAEISLADRLVQEGLAVPYKR